MRAVHMLMVTAGMSAVSACAASAKWTPTSVAAAPQTATFPEFLYAPDGATGVQAYVIDVRDGALREVHGSPYPCQRGTAPSNQGQIAVDPVANYLYCSATDRRSIVGYYIYTVTRDDAIANAATGY